MAALFPEVSQAGLDIDAGHFLHDPLGVLVVVLAPHKPAYRGGNGFNSHAYKRPISPAGAIKSGGACAIIRIVERSDDVHSCARAGWLTPPLVSTWAAKPGMVQFSA